MLPVALPSRGPGIFSISGYISRNMAEVCERETKRRNEGGKKKIKKKSKREGAMEDLRKQRRESTWP